MGEKRIEFSWTGNLFKFADIAKLLGEDTSCYTLKRAVEASSSTIYGLLDQI